MTEADKNQRKEQVGQSDKIVQILHYSERDPAGLAVLPQIGQIASEFFRPSAKAYKNIFVVEAPAMPALNIPHFREWQQRTGRYLEGYIQHTKTGFLKGKPMTDEELKGIRSNLEEIFSDPYITSSSDEEMVELHFYGGLLMLDRLAEERDFTLKIEPAIGNSIIDQYKKGRRLKRMHDKNQIGPDDYKDPEELLEAFRRESTNKFRDQADLLKDRIYPFQDFLEGVIAKDDSPSKILVLREILFSDIDRIRFEQGIVKDVKYDFLPFQAILGGGAFLELTGAKMISRFVQNQKAEVSKEEELTRLTLALIQKGLNEMRLEDTFVRNADQFLENVTMEELKNHFAIFVKDNIEGMEKLLDLFGEKTTGSTYGRGLGGLGFILNARALTSKMIASQNIGEELRGAIEDQKKRQEG